MYVGIRRGVVVGKCGRGEGQWRDKRRKEEKGRKLRKRGNEKQSKGSVVVSGLLGVVWTMVFLRVENVLCTSISFRLLCLVYERNG